MKYVDGDVNSSVVGKVELYVDCVGSCEGDVV